MTRHRPAGPAVGVCLGAWGAVIAVLAEDPLRLTALGEVGWPGDPAAPVARRALNRARRRLALARWQPVAVVVDPSLAGGAAGSTRLLAAAGLAQGWVVPAGRAAELLRAEPPEVDAPLLPVAAGPAAASAVGAACAARRPPAIGAPEPAPIPAERPAPTVVGLGGWTVRQIDDTRRTDRGVHDVDPGEAGGRRRPGGAQGRKR